MLLRQTEVCRTFSTDYPLLLGFGTEQLCDKCLRHEITTNLVLDSRYCDRALFFPNIDQRETESCEATGISPYAR